MPRIYFDHNATAPLHPTVQDAMVAAMSLANPSSLHREGQRARSAVEGARRQVATLLGARDTEVVFTSGATEANNLAAATLARTEGAILATVVEHPSMLAPLKALEAAGRTIVWLAVDARGQLPAMEDIAAQCDAANVTAATIMLANNETGNVHDVASIAALMKERGALMHTDATQAVGRIDVDVVTLGVDLLSLSGHKFGGPKGTGALFVESDVAIGAHMHGGHQERGRRGGTENVPAIVGLGVAAELAQAADWGSVSALRDELWTGITALAPEAVWQGDRDAMLPNTLNVRFPDVDGETLLINFDLDGVAVSAGSACTAGSMEPSHVILAMGISPGEARGSIRFSLSPLSTSEEVRRVLTHLPAVLRRSRIRGA